MRNTFAEVLSKLMESDKNAVLLTADLGWGSFDEIRKRFPEQFFNIGLAEQAMVGVSGGLAKMGKNDFVY